MTTATYAPIDRRGRRHFGLAALDATSASDYFNALQTQLTSVLGSVLAGTAYRIEAGAQGDFAYNYLNPTSQVFNLWTYEFMSGRVTQGADANSIALQGAGSYEQAYLTLCNQLCFFLDPKDSNAMTQAQNNAATIGGDLVQAYEADFGQITSPQLVAAATALGINTTIVPFTNIDFIIDYVLGVAWAGTGKNVVPLTRTQMQNAENLARLLPNMPGDGQGVVNLVSEYLGAFGPANQLAAQQNYGWWAIGQMQSNLQSNNLQSGPGGMAVVNPLTGQTLYVAGYTILESLDAIQQSLAGSSQVTMSMAVQQSSSSSSSVSINGGAAFDFGDGILDVSGSVSAQYNMTTLAGAGQQISIEIVYDGVTIVPLSPLAWSGAATPTPGATVGWWSPTILQEAFANYQLGASAPSGFKFVNAPQLDLAALPVGTFDNLVQVVISQYPTITVQYEAGDWSQFSQSFATQTNATVSVLGIPIGGENSNTFSAQASQGSSNESFSVSITPNSQAGIPLNEQRAYVLAGIPQAAAVGA